jgi:hypothetical protein
MNSEMQSFLLFFICFFLICTKNEIFNGIKKILTFDRNNSLIPFVYIILPQ